MKQQPAAEKPSATQAVRDSRRRTRRHSSAKEMSRIVLSGLRGEDSIVALCRREGITEGPYFSWSKAVLEAGKKQLVGGTVKELKNQKLCTGTERLANWLLREHRDQGDCNALTTGIEKRFLAARLARPPHNLSCAFATLGPYDVEVQDPNVVLGDAPGLEGPAKPLPLIHDSSS